MKTYVVGTQKNRLNESSFEHPQQMLKMIALGIKIFTISKVFFLTYGKESGVL